MSCMYLDDEVYSYCISGCHKFQNSLLKYSDVSSMTSAEIDALFTKLHEWNHTAYRERYGNKVSDVEYVMLRIKTKPWDSVGRYQLLKCLECILYQCEDASAFEKSSEGQSLTELIDKLRKAIINELPGYQYATWGEVHI